MSRFRWIAAALVVALLVAAPLVLGGCSRFGVLFSATIRTAPSSPVAARATPTVEPQPTAAAPAATLAPRPSSVTDDQAQAVVRGWFDAVAAGDYQKAEALTTGNGTTATRQVTGPIQSEANRRGVQIQGVIQRLDLSVPTSQPESGRAVRAEFDIDVNALMGPVSVPVQKVRGGATFLVQQVDGGARITDIQDATGLPGR